MGRVMTPPETPMTAAEQMKADLERTPVEIDPEDQLNSELELPTIDASFEGRALRGAKARLNRFGSSILKELDVEISKTSDAREKAALNRTKTILKDSMEQLTELTRADCRHGARIMNLALDLMATCADAASRIDRGRIPGIIRRAPWAVGRRIKKEGDDINNNRLTAAIENEIKEKGLSASASEKFARSVGQMGAFQDRQAATLYIGHGGGVTDAGHKSGEGRNRAMRKRPSRFLAWRQC